GDARDNAALYCLLPLLLAVGEVVGGDDALRLFEVLGIVADGAAADDRNAAGERRAAPRVNGQRRSPDDVASFAIETKESAITDFFLVEICRGGQHTIVADGDGSIDVPFVLALLP